MKSEDSRQRPAVGSRQLAVGWKEARIQESGVRIRTTAHGLRTTDFRPPQSQIQNPKSKIDSPEPRTPNPESRLLSLLVILLTAATARAATIEGTVLDPSGGAVPAARVALLAPMAPLAEARSNSSGQYRFENLRAGEYRLVASAPGLASAVAKIDLAPDQITTLDLSLALSSVEQSVVVSASLGGALATQVGSSVSVLSDEQITNQGAQNLLDVLREVPGVALTQAGRRGGATGVFTRGGNSNYNLVMIDGVQVNQFGGDFDFASLPADGVDQVEIVRGPQSALYGSNAVTGVVNVVTHRGQGPPRFTFLAEGGSFTTRRFATGGSGLTGGLSWAYNLSRLDSGGVVTNDDYRNQSAFFSLDFSQSPRREFSFRFFGNANDTGSPGPYGSDPLGFFPGIDAFSRNKQNLFGYQASYAEQFSPRFRQVFTGSVAPNRYYFRTPFGDSYSNHLRGVFNTRSEMTLSNQDFLVAGFEYNREQMKNTYIADANLEPFLLPRTSLAYFAENRWNPSRRWVVIGGVRVDNIRTHELPADGFDFRPLLPGNSILKANPRVAAAYLVRDGGGGGVGATRIHGTFGTGIRAPGGFELAFTNNPKLRPEKTLSFDSGIEQRLFSDRMVFDATYFFNRFKDQIVVLGGSLSNLSSFVSDNLANSRAHGLEASVRLRPVRSFELTGSYTRLNTAILALDGSTLVQSPYEVGQPLVRRPANSGSFNAIWHRGRWMLNLNAYARGKTLDVEPNFGPFGGLYPNKGYFLANTGLSLQLGHGVELYGRLNNFLNQKYEEAFGYPSLRLNFLTGIRIRFPAE
jgi:outer membrane cobalamin receptor